MLRRPGICQKPVITLYETPAYAACGTAVGAEPAGVPENGGVIKSGRIMDMRDGLRQKSMCPWKV